MLAEAGIQAVIASTLGTRLRQPGSALETESGLDTIACSAPGTETRQRSPAVATETGARTIDLLAVRALRHENGSSHLAVT